VSGDDRDRMLAEGPRMAPEPPTVDGGTAGVVPSKEPLRMPGPSMPRGRRRGPRPWYGRVVPLAVIAALAIGRAVGSGHGSGILFALLPVVAVLVYYFVRRARG
jgi:hypothetical protein